MEQNKKKKVLFVCSGNICRSPLAHRLFERIAAEHERSEEFEVDSCGTGAWHEGQNADRRMRKLVVQKGWVLEKYARKMTAMDLDYFDYIIIMDESHKYYIEHHTSDRKQLEKIHFLREYDSQADGDLEVPDPYYEGSIGFERVYDMIERSCRTLLQDLK